MNEQTVIKLTEILISTKLSQSMRPRVLKIKYCTNVIKGCLKFRIILFLMFKLSLLFPEFETNQITKKAFKYNSIL